MLEVVNLGDKFAAIDDYWNPRVAGELNGQMVKLAKFKGEFVWHKHDDEDELFLVVAGTLRMRLRDREALIGPGEFFIVPRGVEHQPCAETDECHVVMLEPATTVNTGDLRNERTREQLQRI